MAGASNLDEDNGGNAIDHDTISWAKPTEMHLTAYKSGSFDTLKETPSHGSLDCGCHGHSEKYFWFRINFLDIDLSVVSPKAVEKYRPFHSEAEYNALSEMP
ncbi:hypothetical protein Tco_0678297 [Tanacetum coccineum]|uniref:6-pyruvoyltetrahydropterin synthase n=1 Tax=Tanacetum coccineum TaxID=301880 RepID=A0ABQ4XEP8_9ASTR